LAVTVESDKITSKLSTEKKDLSLIIASETKQAQVLNALIPEYKKIHECLAYQESS
jgi:hypothetical protein